MRNSDSEPMSMFCGLPVIVAVLPMFDAVATATTYGIGGSPRRRAMRNARGVITRHTMSFTRNAEEEAAV